MADMELPVLDKFCFVFHLKTGCIVLGLINSLITFMVALVLITLAMDVKAEAAAQAKREAAEAGLSGVVYTIFLLLVVLHFLKFLFDLVFVWAVHKERLGIIKKYCIFWIIFLVLFIIGFLKTLFYMEATIVICLMIFLAENIYFICVIRSYMRSVNEDGVL